MMYILIFLWALFIVAVLAICLKRAFCSDTSFEFQNFEAVEIPYVTIDIQGNLLNMLVDTGCAVSMLTKYALDNSEMLYKKSGRNVALSAVTSDTVNAEGITIEFNVGRKTVSEDVFIHDVDDFGNFMAMHNIQLHGILGSSFFDKNNCQIDFKHHTLNVL